MSKELEVTEDEIISNWRSLLQCFHKLIEDNPPAAKIKDELKALQVKATNSKLTARQCEGIFARCENYLNGSYGKNLSHLGN